MTAPLTGYADRISVRAGEKIAFKVSSVGPGPYNAMLVRIIRGDPNPGGLPPKLEDQSELFDARFASRQQHAWPGSYALVEKAKDVTLPAALAVEALIWPTLTEDGPQTVLSRRDPASGAGFALVLTPDGMALECGTARVAVGKKLRSRAWYRVWASADPATGMLRVGQQPLKRAFAVDDEGEAASTAPALVLDAPQPIFIGAQAAADRPAERCFNGKIEAPRIAGAAAWDFARRMQTMEIEDSGPNGLHGRLVNLPTRAMKGASWTGEERDWKAAPQQYAAIHFHDDDLHDCGWADDFSFTIPKDMKSGVWGMQLRCGPHRDVIPFFVRPQVGKPQAKVCYIASTFTYQVYSNFSRGLFNEPFRKRVAEWKAAANNPDDNKDYGLSTYNFHRDGSGVAYSSHLRPLLTWRPDFLTFYDTAGSGMRHLPADTHLTGWLDRLGIAYDVVTDHDLHDKGAEILASYKVVMTGTHPEYHTERTLDALQTYTETGGRRARRVLPRLRRRLWRPVAALGPAAQPSVRHRLFEPGHLRGQRLSPSRGGARQPSRLDIRGREGRAVRRLRLLRRRRGGLRARPARPSPGQPAQRRRARDIGRPRAQELRRRARGAAGPQHHDSRPDARAADPRRHDLYRKAQGRRGVLGRIDHLLRQPAPQQIRQRRLAAHFQRGEPLRRAAAEMAFLGGRSSRG